MQTVMNSTLDVPISSALIVDDHPLFCEALSLTLKSITPVDTIHTVDCLEKALEQLDDGLSPSLILLDLGLPDVEGLDGLIRLKRSAKKTPVIVVSSMAEPRIVASAIQAGASGYVPKHSERRVFQDALTEIWAGRPYYPDGYMSQANPTSQQSDEEETIRRISDLTAQQARILRLVCEGKLNKQIAYDLSIAETTVKAHVTAILRKLGVQSRTQAVLMAQNAKFSNLLRSDAVLE